MFVLNINVVRQVPTFCSITMRGKVNGNRYAIAMIL